jgi:hypothetical protein
MHKMMYVVSRKGNVVLKQHTSLKMIKFAQPSTGCQTFQADLRDGKKMAGGRELETNNEI